MTRVLLFIYTFLITFTTFSQHSVDTMFNISIDLESLRDINVETASQTLEKNEEVSATMYVFTHEQIKQKGYFYLDELLQDVPSIEIQKRANAEYNNVISIRGITGNEKFIIMQDGIRINAHAGSINAVKENYSLHNVKRVEVILGPTSAIYGVDGFTGVINLINFSADEVQKGRFISTYGMYETGHHAGAWGIKGKDVSFSIDGSFYHSQEAFYPKYYSKEYEWYNNMYSKTGGMSLINGDTIYTQIKDYKTPTIANNINAKLYVRNFEFGYSKNMEQHHSSMGVNPRFSIPIEGVKYQTETQTIYISYKYTKNRFSFENNMIKNDYQVDPKSSFISVFSEYNKGYKYASETSILNQSFLSYDFNEQHSFLYGISYQDISSLPNTGNLPFAFDENTSSSQQDLFYQGTNLIDSTGKSLKIKQDFYYLRYQNIGNFVQLQSNFSKRFKTTLGVRYDYNTRYGSSINPRIALIDQLIPHKLTVKLLYGSAFLAPSPYKSYKHYGSFVYDEKNQSYKGNFWHLPNPDLKPETLNSIESVISYKKHKNLFFKSTFYYIHINNLIVNDLFENEVFKNIPIAVVERPINRSSAESYGAVIEMDYLNKIGHAVIRTNASYAYADGKIDNTPLSYTAKHTIKMTMDYSSKRWNISPKLLVRSASSHDVLKNADGSPLQNDAFYTINLYTSYQFNPIYRTLTPKAFIKIDNLTNNRYYHVAYGNLESFGRSPQEPIRILLGIDTTF